MKNIHILPTENPSSLFEIDGHLIINREQLIQPKYYRNIYITNDEEIKEGNWVLGDYPDNPIGKVISKYGEEFTMQSLNGNKHGLAQYDSKKIILTTDQDLIEDGVQAIDDEFLEWFVKNPSCEEVVVERETAIGYAGDRQRTFYGKYEIIIPKEEPNQQTIEDIIMEYHQTAYGKLIEELRKQEQKHHIIDLMKLDEESKQQTFTKPDAIDGEWLSPIPSERQWQEEQLVNIFEHYPTASPKWQYMNGLIQNSLDAKKMYSEEQLRNAMNWMLTQYFEFHEWPAMGRVDHYVQSIKQQEQ